ncbi:MAG: transporter substrate-binding domain-containing protein [Rheinheimera sp.]|nr:transporter substrate-binding domain-containing protein [Rheinheimera sp.]
MQAVKQWCRLGLLLVFTTPALAVAPDAVQAAESRQLPVRIAAEDNWPPFSDEKGKGLSSQLVSAAFARSGYKIETVVVPYARALYYTAKGKTDACWNVTRQANTERDYLLHQQPLFQAASSFYFHRIAKNYRSVAEIPDGTVVGVILGYEYGDLFEQHKKRFQLVEVSTHPQLISLLQHDKVELAIFFDDVLDYYLAQPALQKIHLQKGQLNHISDIYVAFSRATARSAELAKALDAGLNDLQRSGDYQRMLKQFKQSHSSGAANAPSRID